MIPFFADAQHQIRQMRESSSCIGILYMSGDLIKTGINVHYLSMSRNPDSNFETGYGFAINYFDVLNKDDNLKGTFVGYSPQLVMNYYVNKGPAEIFLGGSILLVLGSESIQNETNFFIGPQLKENIGVKLGNALVVKGGLLQLWHFGSDLLPSDFGGFAGIDILF